jgi:ParB family transcriptional regulator, chromosome partitioning protein
VLQAISVRRHPDHPHRWLLNFGARRLRAARMAGLNDIAATVNETATSYDQVIENEQREGLKPLELALFVRSRLALGESQADIARQLGKSAPYVTYATALIDAPDWLMTLYQQGRCRGLRELHELRQLEKQHPGCLQGLHAHRGLITREVVAVLKTSQGRGKDAKPAPTDGEAAAAPAIGAPKPAASLGHAQPAAAAAAAAAAASAADDPGHPAEGLPPSFLLIADLEGALVELVVDAAPGEPGSIFVREPGCVAHRSVLTASLTLLRIEASHRDR